MPRLPTSLLRHARNEHSLLPLLLRTCRDLSSARNELRWLREHVLKTADSSLPPSARHQHLHKLCLQRSKGKPLQYILGSQPFGDLDILCKSGVLIPRPETDSIITYLAQTLLSRPSQPSSLRILDLCTGTGCIPLLLHSLLHPTIPHPLIHGIDISPLAIALARKNLQHNIRLGNSKPSASSQISFQQADIFDDEWLDGLKKDESNNWDVLISNPPYISPHAFTDGSTSRSVRNFEPKVALVPPQSSTSTAASSDGGDTFYPRLLQIADSLNIGLLVFEVADMAQAKRVAGMVLEREKARSGCEIWRDFPGQGGRDWDGEVVDAGGKKVRVVGEGEGRAVCAWRDGCGGGLRGQSR